MNKVVTTGAAQAFTLSGIFDFRSNKGYEFLVSAPNTSVIDAESSSVPVSTLSMMAVA